MENSKKNVSISDIRRSLLPREGERITRIIPPEKKYIRRTAEEFAEGAQPVRSSGSHRMVNAGLLLTPDLKTASVEAAGMHGVGFADWVRAALRKALREGMNPHFELGTEIELEAPPSQDAEKDDPSP